MNTIEQAIKKMAFRKKNGGWEGRISYGSTQYSFYGKTQEICRQKAKEFQKKVMSGNYNPNTITLNEYMRKWLYLYKKKSLEPSSFVRLCSVFEHQIKEGIGKKRLTEIVKDDIQTLINEHTEGSNGKKALAQSGLKRIMHILGPCFADAVEDGIIKNNPCKGVKMPKKSNIVTKTKKQIALSDAEIASLLKALYVTTKEGILKYRDGGVLGLILLTGLREGEMIALEWKDISDGDIHVHRTIQGKDSEKGKIRIKEGTKTTEEGRVLPLNDDIETVLRLLREYDAAHGIESELVACNTIGTMHDPRNLARSLEKAEKRAGLLLHITPHTLRHTFGSKLLREGVNVEVVSELMGHANIMVTYNSYTHVVKKEKAKAMTLVSIANGVLDDFKKK